MEDNRLIETEDQEDFEEEEEEGEVVAELIPVERMTPRGSSEDDDYDSEDEDEDYENDYEDEEDYEEEEIQELIPVEMTSPTVSSSITDGRTSRGAVVINDGLLDDSNDLESCEGKLGSQGNGGGDRGKEELNRCEIDGVFCPICLGAWTSGGKHQICCLPCGHIYGLSCINKWLQRRPRYRKCPECNSVCTLKDVRLLYATRLCFADEELRKTVRSLEAKCAYLEKTVQIHPLRQKDSADCARVIELLKGLSVSQGSLTDTQKQVFESEFGHLKRIQELQMQLLDEQRDHYQKKREFHASLKHKLDDIYIGMREYYRYREWQHWTMFHDHCARANIPPPKPFSAPTLMYYPNGPGGTSSSSQLPPQVPPQ